LYTRRGPLKQGQRSFHKYKSDAEKEELETALFEGRAPTLSKDSNARRWQLTETFESTPESIWEDIDMLEGDPTHRGIGPCATPDKTICSRQKPGSGKDCGIRARVLTSRYVYKIKRSNKTGAVYRFKACLIVPLRRGFEITCGRRVCFAL
jgi:hypothetical protein